MPRYSYGGGPAEYAQFQQSRRDDQIRNILNMMMQMKQYQTGREDELFNRGIEERRTAAMEGRDQYPPEYIAKLDHPELFPAERKSALQEKKALLESDPDTYYKLFPKSASEGGTSSKPVQWRDMATKLGGMIDDEIKGITALLPTWTEYGQAEEITKGTARLTKLKALNLSLLPYIGGDKPIPKEVRAAIENAIAPKPPAPSPRNVMPTPPVPQQPMITPTNFPPAGFQRRNKRTGEVQISDGTQWLTTPKK